MKAKRETEIKEMLCSCAECANKDKYYIDLRELGKNLRRDEDLDSVLTFLNALGNEDRIKIVKALKEKDRCVCELEAILDKSQPSISHHLRELEKANLIRGWKKGKFTYYTIMKEELINQLTALNQEFTKE